MSPYKVILFYNTANIHITSLLTHYFKKMNAIQHLHCPQQSQNYKLNLIWDYPLGYRMLNIYKCTQKHTAFRSKTSFVNRYACCTVTERNKLRLSSNYHVVCRDLYLITIYRLKLIQSFVVSHINIVIVNEGALTYIYRMKSSKMKDRGGILQSNTQCVIVM